MGTKEAVGHDRFPNVLDVQFHPEIALLWDVKRRFRERPGAEAQSLKSILMAAPPSLRFQEEIWRWFSRELVESHTQRRTKD